MPKLVVISRAGQEHRVEAEAGRSIMEVIRDSGVDDLEALCGGCCSCATCHVHVEPAFVANLPPLSEAENELLDCSDHRNATSRLACQIPFSAALEGMRVTIAKEM